MSVSFATLVAILATAVSLLWIKDLRLPYPCFKVVQTIPPEHIAVPSDLRGPYSANTHLQKAKKVFEHEIDSAGERCCMLLTSICIHEHRLYSPPAMLLCTLRQHHIPACCVS